MCITGGGWYNFSSQYLIINWWKRKTPWQRKMIKLKGHRWCSSWCCIAEGVVLQLCQPTLAFSGSKKKKKRKKLIWSYLDLHYNFFPLIISPFIVNHSREFYACNENKRKGGSPCWLTQLANVYSIL